MRKIVLLFFVSILSFYSVCAQQDIVLSQEYFSRANKNPAATGNSGDVDIFLHGRILWAGVEDGPKNMVLNVTNYFEKIKSGTGVSLNYTNVGVARHAVNAKLMYNYQIDLNDRFLLSLGLGAGVNVVSVDYSLNHITDDDERVELQTLNQKSKAAKVDFNTGFELNNPHWTLGFSVNHFTYKKVDELHPSRQVYAYTSFPCMLSAKLDLIPTVAYMHQSRSNVLDVGMLCFLQRLYWMGVSWRPDIQDDLHQSILAFSIGFELKKFRFGYSYDLGLGKDSKLPSNTHEVMLSYGIAKRNKY